MAKAWMIDAVQVMTENPDFHSDSFPMMTVNTNVSVIKIS